MADRHETFQVNCPAKTAQSAPLEVATPFAVGRVVKVTIRWPQGHSSLTGIQIACAHQQLIPFSAGQFILGDTNERDYVPTTVPDSGQWSAILYNTDNRAHYWQITYDVEVIRVRGKRSRAVQGPHPVGDIYNALAGR